MMDYIKEIRSAIGHKPIILCACGCLIFDKQGRVLLQRRKDDNLWGNPGGCMEVGETSIDTVKREILEEVGVEVSNLELFNVYSGADQHHIYSNGDEVYFVNIIYKTSDFTGEVTVADDESLDMKFFDINDLPDNVTGPFVCVARDLRQGQ